MSDNVAVRVAADPVVDVFVARPIVDPIAVTTYDWVHNCLQHGIFNEEVEALLRVAKTRGLSRDEIQSFLKDSEWSFAKSRSRKMKDLHRIFDERRVSSKKSPDKLKCSCSEAVSVYGLLRFLCNS